MGQTSVDTMRGLPFFQHMDPSLVDRLAAMAREVGYEKDQIIFREDEASRQFHVVLAGKVALELATSTGRARVLTVEEGQELGWSFLVAGAGQHLRARALERVRTLAFDGRALSHACEQDAELGRQLTKRLLQDATGRLESTLVRYHGG
ncbi:MAG: cyclic nucleotide-binding domain-containing protein [Bryobacteraceae bacterium]